MCANCIPIGRPSYPTLKHYHSSEIRRNYLIDFLAIIIFIYRFVSSAVKNNLAVANWLLLYFLGRTYSFLRYFSTTLSNIVRTSWTIGIMITARSRSIRALLFRDYKITHLRRGLERLVERNARIQIRNLEQQQSQQQFQQSSFIKNRKRESPPLVVLNSGNLNCMSCRNWRIDQHRRRYIQASAVMVELYLVSSRYTHVSQSRREILESSSLTNLKK